MDGRYYVVDPIDVSIPRTVCGGLQLVMSLTFGVMATKFQYRERYVEGCNHSTWVDPRAVLCFNTENGMWRAAIDKVEVCKNKKTVFQYRERYVEGCNSSLLALLIALISFQYRERYVEGCNSRKKENLYKLFCVSIPRTVCGGLQSVFF